MRTFSIAVLFCFAIAALASAGGGGEQPAPGGRSRADREAPRLEEAVANPVADITGYVVRTAAHWPGPTRGSINGNAILNAWDEVIAEYGVERAWEQTPNPATTLEKLTASVLLGEPFADIVWINGTDAIPVLADNNLILPLDEYVDVDDPRWPDGIDNVTTFRGRTYGIVPWILAPGSGLWYNRTLFQREGIPDPQDLVRSGEWTWDRYIEIAEQTTRDTDGDGEIDQWGITVGYEIEYHLLHANGAQVVERVGDDRYQFGLSTPAAIDALDFISEIYQSNVVSYAGESLFVAGRAAMYGGELFQGNNMLNNMEDEYGWVYYPKGPGVDEYFTIAGPPVMIVFPANLNFPPDLLGEIVTRTTPFDEMEAVQREFVEGQVRTQRDLEMVLEMIDNTTFTVGVDSFPGLRRQVGEIFRAIRNGTSAATAVAQYEQPAQAAIDAVFR